MGTHLTPSLNWPSNGENYYSDAQRLHPLTLHLRGNYMLKLK